MKTLTRLACLENPFPDYFQGKGCMVTETLRE